MRWIVLTCALAMPGCRQLQTLTVNLTVSPTLHLDGIGRGVEVQASVVPGAIKK